MYTYIYIHTVNIHIYIYIQYTFIYKIYMCNVYIIYIYDMYVYRGSPKWFPNIRLADHLPENPSKAARTKCFMSQNFQVVSKIAASPSHIRCPRILRIIQVLDLQNLLDLLFPQLRQGAGLLLLQHRVIHRRDQVGGKGQGTAVLGGWHLLGHKGVSLKREGPEGLGIIL